MDVAAVRVRLALVLFGLVMLATSAARAQDPRATSAQQSARAFLALTDRDDGKASWQAAGKQFQTAITDARWASALHDARVPLGAVVERGALSTNFMKTFPGATAEGDYAIVIYRTAFANRTDARETLTLERETDGTWRVVGYFIQ